MKAISENLWILLYVITLEKSIQFVFNILGSLKQNYCSTHNRESKETKQTTSSFYSWSPQANCEWPAPLFYLDNHLFIISGVFYVEHSHKLSMLLWKWRMFYFTLLVWKSLIFNFCNWLNFQKFCNVVYIE